jgi:hypothetical protein
MRNVFVIIITSLMVLSCGPKGQNDGSYIERELHGISGRMVSEIPYANDSTIHGTVKYYFPNEQIREEIEFNNGKKDGINVAYRKDGSIMYRKSYAEDSLDGASEWYYSTGILEGRTEWVRGNRFGLGEWYYPEGNKEAFVAVDFYNDPFYIVKYDTNSIVVQNDGMSFSPNLWFVPHPDSIPLDQEFLVQIAIAELPNAKTSIRMGRINGPWEELQVDNAVATYWDTFHSSGKHLLMTIGSIQSVDDELVRNDTIITEIIVLEDS